MTLTDRYFARTNCTGTQLLTSSGGELLQYFMSCTERQFVHRIESGILRRKGHIAARICSNCWSEMRYEKLQSLIFVFGERHGGRSSIGVFLLCHMYRAGQYLNTLYFNTVFKYIYCIYSLYLNTFFNLYLITVFKYF